MNRVTSRVGTTITFDRLDDGYPVIVVGGQLCDRALTCPTAVELAKHFTVINYDRRGRGDSGNTSLYALECEIEDISALIAEALRLPDNGRHQQGWRGAPSMYDRREQAVCRRPAERTTPCSGGPGARRAPEVLLPVLTEFFNG